MAHILRAPKYETYFGAPKIWRQFGKGGREREQCQYFVSNLVVRFLSTRYEPYFGRFQFKDGHYCLISTWWNPFIYRLAKSKVENSIYSTKCYKTFRKLPRILLTWPCVCISSISFGIHIILLIHIQSISILSVSLVSISSYWSISALYLGMAWPKEGERA